MHHRQPLARGSYTKQRVRRRAVEIPAARVDPRSLDTHSSYSQSIRKQNTRFLPLAAQRREGWKGTEPCNECHPLTPADAFASACEHARPRWCPRKLAIETTSCPNNPQLGWPAAVGGPAMRRSAQVSEAAVPPSCSDGPCPIGPSRLQVAWAMPPGILGGPSRVRPCSSAGLARPTWRFWLHCALRSTAHRAPDGLDPQATHNQIAN